LSSTWTERFFACKEKRTALKYWSNHDYKIVITYNILTQEVSIFDVVDFVGREGRVNTILIKIKESLNVVFLDGDIGMYRETAMVPGAHFIYQSVTDTIMFFNRDSHLFLVEIGDCPYLF